MNFSSSDNPMLGYKAMGAGMPGLLVQAICIDAAYDLVAAGTTNLDALELANAMCTVITTPLNSGVILSSKATPGDWQFILNSGANSLNVYPPVGKKFAYSVTDAPDILPAGVASLYVQFSPSVWY